MVGRSPGSPTMNYYTSDYDYEPDGPSKYFTWWLVVYWIFYMTAFGLGIRGVNKYWERERQEWEQRQGAHRNRLFGRTLADLPPAVVVDDPDPPPPYPGQV